MEVDEMMISVDLLKLGGIIIGTVITILVIGFIKKFNLIYQAKHPVDTKSTRNGGEIVADVLKAHDVEYIFTLCGGHISPILVSCDNIGIRVIDTRGEANAAFAADAVSRLSGTIGVVAVTAGPGLTNVVTAIKNAQMAESPVLLLGGAAASILKGRGALQDIDQLSLFKTTCKYCATVTRVRDIAPTLRKAISIAQSNTPGPVFIEFPIDTLYPYQTVHKEVGIKRDAKGLMQKIINWYLNNYITDLFSGAWDERSVAPLPVHIPYATDRQVQKCVELVSRAKKPVILLGSQVTLPPTPSTQLVNALETLGIPCFLGGMSRGLLGRDSPLQMRQRRREALQGADLVILGGAVCDFRLGYGRSLSRSSKIISVNRDKGQLMKNSDMFWKPKLAVLGDPADLIVRVAKALPDYTYSGDWLLTLRNNDLEKETANIEMSSVSTGDLVNPIRLLHRLEEIGLENDSILVADGGDFVATAAYTLRPRGPLCWLDPGPFGTLGVGGGFALGAKLCRPNSDVWIIYGDGALGYSIVEMDTFRRFKTPVIALVGNDACWTQIAREQIPMFKSNVACTLEYTAYDEVASGFDAVGIKLTQSSDTAIDDAITRAKREYSNGKSVLINALIGSTDFRKGSISV